MGKAAPANTLNGPNPGLAARGERHDCVCRDPISRSGTGRDSRLRSDAAEPTCTPHPCSVPSQGRGGPGVLRATRPPRSEQSAQGAPRRQRRWGAGQQPCGSRRSSQLGRGRGGLGGGSRISSPALVPGRVEEEKGTAGGSEAREARPPALRGPQAHPQPFTSALSPGLCEADAATPAPQVAHQGPARALNAGPGPASPTATSGVTRWPPGPEQAGDAAWGPCLPPGRGHAAGSREGRHGGGDGGQAGAHTRGSEPSSVGGTRGHPALPSTPRPGRSDLP